MHTAAQLLKQELATTDWPVSRVQQTQLIQFLELMKAWGKVYNLTAILEPRDMVYRHLLDSLALLPYLTGPRILDVGTGAGLPGLPLAIVRPDLEFTLLDSNQKKTAFVQHVITSLGLKQAKVHKARVESWESPVKFDQIIARAFCSLQELAEKTGHLCSLGGTLIAMKAQLTEEELQALRAPYHIERIEPVEVPGLAASRCLVFIKGG